MVTCGFCVPIAKRGTSRFAGVMPCGGIAWESVEAEGRKRNNVIGSTPAHQPPMPNVRLFAPTSAGDKPLALNPFA